MGIGGGKVPQPGADKRERKYGWTAIPADPLTTPAPDLDGDEHTARGHALWARWWALPVARMWSRDIDTPALERLLALYELQWMGEKGLPWAEIRQGEDRFGLSPAARLRLHWQVAGVDCPAATPDRLGHETAPQPVAAVGGASDPRRLRAVQ